MSKAVMLSIRPKWCEKIISGEKTVEVRKTRPKLETPFKCYIYCTVGRAGYDALWILDAPTREEYSFIAVSAYLENPKGANKGNRKVIGEFICDRIYELAPLNHAPDDVEKQACMTREEIVDYLRGTGYGWHIVNLKIYDTPRELSEFRRACPNSWYCESCAMYRENNGTCGNESLQLKRAPQSWCYVEAMKDD
uniref:ASCH domain-containing protein n=1 Tax=Podoviridae sp. ctyDR6 TaxID=2825288 RepID=A0A8S5QK86_9CAUD|nr:MAG TPA: hypothetical protein [Podoviridae sp. ctyDR6]